MKKFLLLIAILLLANCTFAYISNIDGVVENIAAKHSLNPYKLKALTILISNQQISLSGFDAIHVGIYPGMSNESLVFELGKIIDKYDTNSNSSKLNNFINSLSSQVANKSVNTLLQETVLNLKRADNAYFDTQVINQYYDFLLEGGKSKAEAWTLAMKEQDAYRATQDTRKVITENNNRIYIAEQENYVYSLYNQMINSKGLALNLPYFGLFKDENTINEDFYELKKSCFVEGENMEPIKNPLERIEASKKANSATLLFLETLKDYPLCVSKAALNWTEGERNSLTMAVAGVLKKVSKTPIDEAINVITNIVEHNKDEELSGRVATVESTYANDDKDIVACSVMKGDNENLMLSQIYCQSNCRSFKNITSIKAKIRAIQTDEATKGIFRKDKIAELVISELLNLGKLYKANNLYYIFLSEEKRLICISDDPLELRALFTKWGINASENLYKYVLNELYVYCISQAEQVEIHKFAYYNPKTFVLYIYNGIKEILKITSDKIETIENGDDGVMFTELNNYEPFQLVDIDEKVDYIEKYLTDNLNIDKDASLLNLVTQRKIAKIWFYSLFFESIMKTKPIFTAIGSKGSGKTTFLRRIGQILFGKKFDVTSVANDCKDLETLITNNYYVVIDNLDNPPKTLNDALARIATGQIIKKRKLFTTNQELEFEVKCYVALTSRTPQFTRDDVADRLICVYLERFGLFKDESNLCKVVMDKRDEILSYAINHLQKIIKKLKDKQDEEYKVDFRMADFAVFALKTAENKKEQKELEKIFATMIKIQNEFTLRDDVLYLAFREFVKDTNNKGKRFIPAELYKLLKFKAAEMGLEKPFEAIYKNPKLVSTRLKNIKDNISDEILIYYKKGHKNQYYYTFELVDDSEYQDSLI